MAKSKKATATDPGAEASAVTGVEPWEGTRVCLITRHDKDIVARRLTWDEYQSFVGGFAVEVTNEE